MAGRVRIRGELVVADPAAGVIVPMYLEGTETVVTVGASDKLSVDSLEISAAAGSNTVHFSDAAGAPDAGSIFFHIFTNETVSHPFPSPVSGLAGNSVYVQSSGANKIALVFTGWLYQA